MRMSDQRPNTQHSVSQICLEFVFAQQKEDCCQWLTQQPIVSSYSAQRRYGFGGSVEEYGKSQPPEARPESVSRDSNKNRTRAYLGKFSVQMPVLITVNHCCLFLLCSSLCCLEGDSAIFATRKRVNVILVSKHVFFKKKQQSSSQSTGLVQTRLWV